MKKIFLACVCCLLLMVSGCRDEGGKIKKITIPQVIKKLENKDTFVLNVSRDSCEHCQDLEEVLSKTLKQHSTIIYNVRLNEKSYETLVDDVKKLEKYISEPGTTPHIYYIYEGSERDSYTGFDESNKNQFWDFVKVNGLENAK